jgi:hypothetical protein
VELGKCINRADIRIRLADMFAVRSLKFKYISARGKISKVAFSSTICRPTSLRHCYRPSRAAAGLKRPHWPPLCERQPCEVPLKPATCTESSSGYYSGPTDPTAAAIRLESGHPQPQLQNRFGKSCLLK